MPLHDWTRADGGLFHHFHQGLCCEISSFLNRPGILDHDFSALIERANTSNDHGGIAVEPVSDNDYYVGKANRVVIRHRLGKIVAFIEIVSPGNKDGAASLRQFVEKLSQSLRQGVHVLVIDPFPPTACDPFGIHKAIWDEIEVEDFELPAGQNRILASYEGDKVFSAFVETVGVGELLPDMPLFIAPGAHVMVPLEATYAAAWEATPAAVRRLVGAQYI